MPISDTCCRGYYSIDSNLISGTIMGTGHCVKKCKRSLQEDTHDQEQTEDSGG